MLSGLMMDYPLTIDRVLEHGNRLYPYKQIKTKLPGGGLHTYTYRDLYGGSSGSAICSMGWASRRAIASAPSPGTTTSTSNSTSARRARARSCIRSTFASFPSSWPSSSTTPRTK